MTTQGPPAVSTADATDGWRSTPRRSTITRLAFVMVATITTLALGPIDHHRASALPAATPTGLPDPTKVATLTDPNAYPSRGFADIKGLQPDYWPTPADFVPGLGTVAMNLHWASWEPVLAAPPCASGQLELDGHCFTIPADVDHDIRAYTELGVAVTGIFYGTPAWARGSRPCSPAAPGFEGFCVPDQPEDYARFVRLIADRYDGAKGHGRVVDFVIQNEVNTNEWFNVGCGAGVTCDLGEWVEIYAGLYDRAYDAIRAAQPRARVLFSFTHHFETVFDRPDLVHPIYSIKTFLTRLVPLVGDRDWSVALHPYPNNLVSRLDARDLPFATLGNIGVLPGWLRATFPDDPHAWEVQLTEVGLHNPGTLDAEQRDSLCQAMRNVLGTPGITSFIYHRLRDHPAEMGLKLGLRRDDDSPKPAYDTWLHATDAAAPSCGFERDGHTVVRHGIDPTTGGQWFSSRDLPAGYRAQAEEWTLSYAEQPGTRLLHECGDGSGISTFLWSAAGCDEGVPMGPVGWIATQPAPGLTGLIDCRGTGYRITTTAAACAPDEVETLLGFVAGTPGPARPTAGDDTVGGLSGATTPPSGTGAVVAAPAFTG